MLNKILSMMHKKHPCLSYVCANESLEAIIAGLNPGENDNTLAIGGSGDQAFAILEHSARVYVVDIKKSQTDYIKKRARLLETGDYAGFLQIPPESDFSLNPTASNKSHLTSREHYFTKERFDRIRKRVSELRILPPIDVLRAIKIIKGLTKIYLSNALEFGKKLPDFTADLCLEQISNTISKDSLIYVANHDYLVSSYEKFSKTYLHGIEVRKSLLPPTLVLDQKLTQRARHYQKGRWKPAVYRKI